MATDLSKINEKIARASGRGIMEASKKIHNAAKNATTQNRLFNPTDLTAFKTEDLPKAYSDWLKGWSELPKLFVSYFAEITADKNGINWKYKATNERDQKAIFTCSENGAGATFEAGKSSLSIPQVTCPPPIGREAISKAIDTTKELVSNAERKIATTSSDIQKLQGAVHNQVYTKSDDLKKPIAQNYSDYDKAGDIVSVWNIGNLILNDIKSQLQPKDVNFTEHDKWTFLFDRNFIMTDEVAEGEEEEGGKKKQNPDDHLSSQDREILLNAFLDDTSDEYEFTGHVTTKNELIHLFAKTEKVYAESLDPSNSDNQEFISIYDKVKATILKWKDKFDSARKTIKTAQKNKTLIDQIKKIEAYESEHLPNYTINDKMKKPHTVAEATRAIAELNQTLPLLQRDLARKQAILDRLKAL